MIASLLKSLAEGDINFGKGKIYHYTEIEWYRVFLGIPRDTNPWEIRFLSLSYSNLYLPFPFCLHCAGSLSSDFLHKLPQLIF